MKHEKYNISAFNNISSSEQKHMDDVVAKIKQELKREISATARSDTQNSTKKTGYSFIDLVRVFLYGLVIGASVMFLLKTFKIV